MGRAPKNQHEEQAKSAAKGAKGSKADAATSRSIALARTGKIARMFKARTFGPGKKGTDVDLDLDDVDSCGYGDVF